MKTSIRNMLISILLVWFVWVPANALEASGLVITSEQVEEGYTAIAGRFPSSLGDSVFTLYRPEGEGPYPTVYFIQGYTCSSIEHDDMAGTARKRLLEEFARAGFLVFLVQKPGIGSDAAKPVCEKINYDAEANLFASALTPLLTSSDVDQDNLFIFGHSMGGVTAPLIADSRIKGLVTYGAVVKPWFEYMVDNYRTQSELFGFDPKRIQEETRLAIPFLYDLMIAKADWSEMQERHAEALEKRVVYVAGEQTFGRHYSYWSSLNDKDIVGAWAGYEGKVLAIYGGYDVEAISDEAAERTARIVNTYHPGNATFMRIENAEHGFARVEGSFEDYAKSRLDRSWTKEKAYQQFDQRIADETIHWMQKVMEE